MGRATIAGLVCWGILIASAGAAEPDRPALAAKAQAVLKANCYRCHGQDGVFEGGMNFILDPGKLIATKKIVPEKPEESKLYQRVVKGTMPPADEQPRPNDADKAVLKEWIAAGAPVVHAGVDTSRSRITDADLQRWMLDDLEHLERRSRRFVRYFSIAHLYNQGLSDDELQTYRNALSKLINSLSWHPKISLPQPVDPHRTLLRIDLRWYMWDATLWNRVLAEYPYGVLDDSVAARAVMVGTATKLPLVRADWFIATASRAPLYYELLQLPGNLSELERQLRVDAAVDIQQERVARAGFNGSGVSKNNRILERHDSVHGVYWRTYDFDAVPQNLVERGNLLPDKRNVFAYPLGPVTPPGSESFQHAAGEAIFSLPNGLHGFMLVNANNVRQDKGATQIVSDPKRPDRAVEAGVSCMSCHLTGINPKSDQIRDFVGQHPKSFSRVEAEVVRALYPPDEKMKKWMDADAERYRKAVEQTGTKVTKTEPVSTLTLRYEADLDLSAAAAEAGLTPAEFAAKIGATSSLARNLGALRSPGGTVSRQVFVQAFGDMVRDLKPGTLFSANINGGILPDNTGDLDPLESQGGQVNHAAFCRDGKLALLASADRSVRMFDVQAGRDIKRFVGHTASVWCVAFSSDERQALSGSMDGTVRLWDVASGQELKRFDAHLTLVACVAFSPNGKQALSGGYDGAVVLYDLESLREIRRWENLGKYIHALAFSPSGRAALVAADKAPTIIDLGADQKPLVMSAQAAAVTSVAYSPDGRQILFGCDDGKVVWRDTGEGRWCGLFATDKVFLAHAGPVRDVAFAPSGRVALTAGADRTVQLWGLEVGKLLATFRQHTEPVVRVAFIDGGRQTVSISRDGAIKFWPLKKFEALTVAKSAEQPGAGSNTSSTPEPAVLKPSAVIPLGATLGNLTLSPNRKWLFVLDRTNGELVQIDAGAFKVTKRLSLPETCDTFTLTHDGKTLVAVAADDGRSELILIDPISLNVRERFHVDVQACDIAASDGGLIFLSGRSGGWADVAVVDWKKERIAGRWGGVWTNSLLRLSGDQLRLYVSSQGVSPGKLEAFPIPVKLDEKPGASSAASEAPLGGPFMITPDGQFAILQTGAVLRLSANRTDDLQSAARLPPHLAAVADPDAGKVLTTDGMTIKQYSYPELKWQTTYRLSAQAHQLGFDGKAGRLFVAAIDLQSFRDRPRAKAVGDLQVYEIQESRK
jgi:WD40 repeat protein